MTQVTTAPSTYPTCFAFSLHKAGSTMLTRTLRDIRKGHPGDHKEKLAAETIAWLNGYFHDTGHAFGYELN